MNKMNVNQFQVQRHPQKVKFARPQQHLQLALSDPTDLVLARIEKTQHHILSRLQKDYLEGVFTQILDERLNEIVKSLHNVMERLDGGCEIKLEIKGEEDKQKSYSHIEISKPRQEEEINNRIIKMPYQYQQSVPKNQDEQQIYSRQVECDEEDYDQFSSMSIFQENLDNPSEFFDHPNQLLYFLKDKFEEMDLNFTKYQRVYDYEDMKHINFHDKIDKKHNVFFMAELQNKEVIGAFTHLPFEPQPNYIPKPNPKSFICNLNKKVFIYAYKANRTHTYDKYFLIFGNWQIKVKAKDDMLETQWGGNGDCFLRKQYGVDQKTSVKLEWLFGAGASRKFLKMKQYQIYIFS